MGLPVGSLDQLLPACERESERASNQYLNSIFIISAIHHHPRGKRLVEKGERSRIGTGQKGGGAREENGKCRSIRFRNGMYRR